MSIEVFWGSGSTPAMRVLLAFAAKGQPYESRLLSFSARDTRTPEFLAINPRGKVPAIREGDFCLNESLAILAWLEARFPEPPLFGRTPEEIGRSWALCMEYVNHGDPAVSAVARPLLFGEAPAVGSLAEARAPLVEELDRLAARVSRGTLVGDAIGAADITWYCGLRFLERGLTRPRAQAHALDLHPLLARWPALGPWAARIEALPGFEATLPPHWLQGEAASAPRLQ